MLKPKGDFATVEGLPADLFVELDDLTGPSGDVTVDPELLILDPLGKKLTLKAVDLADFGAYVMQLSGDAGSIGWAAAKLKIKPPKLPKMLHLADPALDQP